MDNMPYLIGGLVGGLLGMGLLAHLPYMLLRRLPFPAWVAVGLSPVLLYCVAIWGYWDRGIVQPTAGYTLGAITFMAIRRRDVGTAVGKAVAVALGGMGCLLATFGPTTEFNVARRAAIEGCRSSLQKTGVTGIDYGQATAYCDCTTAEILGPSCRRFSLLWSKAATEACSKIALESVATPDGALRMEARKDACIQQHLPSHKGDFLAVSRKWYQEQGVRQILQEEELAKSDLDAKAKSDFANCYMTAALDACPKKTLAGYSECFHATPSEGVGAGCRKMLGDARRNGSNSEAERREWGQITTPEFVIPFPADVHPTEEVLPVKSMEARTVTWRHDAEASSYQVMFAEYPQEFVKNRVPSKMLQGAREGALANSGTQLVRTFNVLLESGIPGKKWPGNEFEASSPNGWRLRARIYLVENRLYQIILVSTGSSEQHHHP